MRRTIAAVGLVGLGLLGTTLPAIATPGDGQVTVCHETGSETNPVIEIDVNENAPESNGNGGNGGNNGNSGTAATTETTETTSAKKGNATPTTRSRRTRSHPPRSHRPKNRRPRSASCCGTRRSWHPRW